MVVIPSRRLLMLVAVLCTCVVSIGCALALGAVGEVAIWTRLLCGAACLLFAGGGFAYTLHGRSIYRLDISGSGQIRLFAHVGGVPEMTDIASMEPPAVGMLVTLLADSTLWSGFMLLRLEDEDGRLHVLPILPDSLSTESFRALSVACRWIAAHRFSEIN